VTSARRERRARLSLAVFGVVLGSVAQAGAQAGPGPAAPGNTEEPLQASATSGAGVARRGRSAPVSGLLSLGVGRGLRFNNPYRLAKPLGDTPESVSLAATYLDLGAAVLFGPRAFRHGAALGGAVALQGIGQFVLTPSYLAELGLADGIGLRGRVGVPVVVAPDTTLGLEAAVGPRLDMAYGLGALLELVGSVYFGAATDETNVTTIPMLSLQVGVFFDHQLSP
jgi:hypothetical protein